MPLSVDGALRWREEFKDIRGEKTGPKTLDYYDEETPSVPRWVREEWQEISLARRIHRLNGDDPQLPVLRRQFEKLADTVLGNLVDLITAAINRRFYTCPGFEPDEAFEKYIEALASLVDRWQQVLDVSDESDLETSSSLTH
jgi:hypothetical protein